MRIMHTVYFCSFLLLLALTYGCPNVSKPYPERTYYLFEIPNPTTTMTTIKGTTLEINRFSVSPTSQGREFIYRTTDLEYKADFYNQFFKPPDNIMTEAVRQWLNQSGLFEDVLNPTSQALPKYVIEGNIVELYGDYRNQSAANAVLKLQFFLLQMPEDDGDPNIIFGKTYESAKPIGESTPQNLMNGWNLALGDILGEFLKDLSSYLPKAQQQ